ncbi:hypothetical protein [Dyadobacter sp. CY347]|uniref:hypothetical protein n=1 Tax=Dyadobacter sp. CY347 TaxID=2909336 RepID=UPI001F2CD9C2|nr:hypothetical protein [Dyadobacter sp. CY347]MCF2487495.1 hypothetical protein [Dyadobacter sp. CY347]
MNRIYLVLLLSLLLASRFSVAQESVSQPATKLDKFTSKSGVIIKFEDYNLTGLAQQFGASAETKIRKVHSGDDVKLFYLISNKTEYGLKVAAIASEDFTELSKALGTLQGQLVIDLQSKADYLENKYVTEDGFHLGYLIQKGKPTWYMRLEKYGSGGSIFLNQLTVIEDSFKLASTKLNELK